MSNWRPLKYFCIGLAQYGLNLPASYYIDAGTRFLRTSDISDHGEVTDVGAVYVEDSIIGSDHQLIDGDLLLSRSGTLGRCLRYQTALGKATFAGYLIRFRPSPENVPRFLEYCTQSKFFQQAIEAAAPSSTISNFNAERYANLLLPWWSRDRQHAIAAFLDCETEKVDGLVAEKQLLIERLAEFRTALITRTVTRGLPSEAARTAGLDPSPRLKPSSVEWLGEVPEHWEVKRLEHVASYRTSSVDKKTKEGELPVRLCNYTDVYYRDRIRASDGDFMQATASPHEVAQFRLSAGDVLITKDSEDWRDIAVPALVDEAADDFVCGYHLGIIRPGALVDPAFMLRTMQSVTVNQQLQISASGVTRYGLPIAAVGEVLVALPPLDEQRAIAAFLDQQTQRIDVLGSRVEAAIERLLEYRTALVTAAVTGKVDVRRLAVVEVGGRSV